jgi:hypothetical protein
VVTNLSSCPGIHRRGRDDRANATRPRLRARRPEHRELARAAPQSTYQTR